ncbi:SynChlorMet cassette protein ScmD [Desulfurobacterium crinifex]
MEKPIANPDVLLREEFDDWALLFNPNTGKGFGINPVGVFVWKLLDGKHSVNDIVEEVRKNFRNVPDNVDEEVKRFIAALSENGLVVYELSGED